MPSDTEQNLEESLKRLMMERCGIPEEKFRQEATLQGDLELDSLDAVELAMALEDESSGNGVVRTTSARKRNSAIRRQ